MVVNGSLSKTAVNGVGGREVAALRARRRRADDRHAAVPDRAVRVAAGGDAGRGRDRRRDRARRLPVAARGSTATRRGALRQAYGVAAPAGLPRRDRRAARRAVFDTLPGPVHRHRDLAAAVALPRVEARTSRRSAASTASYVDVARNAGRRRRPTGIAILRVEGGLYFANADAVRAAAAGRRRRRARGDPRRRDDPVRRRHRGERCSTSSPATCAGAACGW